MESTVRSFSDLLSKPFAHQTELTATPILMHCRGGCQQQWAGLCGDGRPVRVAGGANGPGHGRLESLVDQMHIGRDERHRADLHEGGKPVVAVGKSASTMAVDIHGTNARNWSDS